ncbi:MAG: aminoacetone oxidase family FAD-binding enzyme [Candidatus Sumerlaeia bacterium]|nr:aminoacetone oxidase family FAD-binding enzyme [Candidatus Sumerlaeia bacterium]
MLDSPATTPEHSETEQCDLAIIGAGAAGLTAAIFAGRENLAQQLHRKILLLDGARRPGAKILVSGGGRCNITNDKVGSSDYCTSGSTNVVRNILTRFNQHQVLEWMQGLGVEVKREEPWGKYFPVSDTAKTVLEALMQEVARLNVELRAGERVQEIIPLEGGGFRILQNNRGPVLARRVILATGGLSLPKSGSDGWGLEWARQLGHEIVPTTPSLVPLVTDGGDPVAAQLQQLSGVTWRGALDLVQVKTGKVVYSREDSMLLTHFGLSGPAVLDFSRHWLRTRMEHPAEEFQARLRIPRFASLEAAHSWLKNQTTTPPKNTLEKLLTAQVPQALAAFYAQGVGGWATISKEERHRIGERLGGLPLALQDSRGYPFAETTAGGIALGEIDWRTMESKRVPGLYFCGEVLDVDGRIGGFNFQWAWSSGFVAGNAAV